MSNDKSGEASLRPDAQAAAVVDGWIWPHSFIRTLERIVEGGNPGHIAIYPSEARYAIHAFAALASTPQPASAETVDSWLVEQLEAWPRRVDPNKTTNVEYLMKEAAKVIRQSAKGGE